MTPNEGMGFRLLANQRTVSNLRANASMTQWVANCKHKLNKFWTNRIELLIKPSRLKENKNVKEEDMLLAPENQNAATSEASMRRRYVSRSFFFMPSEDAPASHDLLSLVLFERETSRNCFKAELGTTNLHAHRGRAPHNMLACQLGWETYVNCKLSTYASFAVRTKNLSSVSCLQRRSRRSKKTKMLCVHRLEARWLSTNPNSYHVNPFEKNIELQLCHVGTNIWKHPNPMELL